MRVLFVTSEAFPFAKTGGLADVSAALPTALQDRGADVRVLLPAYPEALERAPSAREIMRLGDPLGCGETRILETYMPHTGRPVWLVDCPSLYNRAGGLYQDGNGRDWVDNDLRFALLGHGSLAMGDTDLTERIRQRAYKILESEGRPHGCDSAHWLRAEAEIREGLKASGPTEKSLKPTRKPPHKSAALSKRSPASPQQRSRKG